MHRREISSPEISTHNPGSYRWKSANQVPININPTTTTAAALGINLLHFFYYKDYLEANILSFEKSGRGLPKNFGEIVNVPYSNVNGQIGLFLNSQQIGQLSDELKQKDELLEFQERN